MNQVHLTPMKNFRILLVALTALLTAHFAPAQTWTQTSALNNYWYAIASSADGTKLVAEVVGGGIYTSTNSGINWVLTTAPTNYWQGVASSADGVKLVAAVNSGGIYTSTNSGTTWMQQTNAPSLGWNTLASSADGTKLIAAVGLGGGPIYTSTNSGVTWTQTSAPITNWWTSVASSADGKNLAAAEHGGSPDFVGGIYTSTNSGATWTLTSAPLKEWLSIASSADGTKLVAADYMGLSPIYTSANSGATWMTNNTPKLNWSSVAYQQMEARWRRSSGLAVLFRPQFTLQRIREPLGKQTMRLTKLGNLSCLRPMAVNWWRRLDPAAAFTLSQIIFSPQLKITSSKTKPVLSWTITSTNFVLQQSPDLTSLDGHDEYASR